jgi:hypothetical protein
MVMPPWLIGVIVLAGILSLSIGGVLCWECAHPDARPDAATDADAIGVKVEVAATDAGIY